jgi:hypothetical protein
LQEHYVSCQKLLNRVLRHYTLADPLEKLIITGGVFALDEQLRTKQQ